MALWGQNIPLDNSDNNANTDPSNSYLNLDTIYSGDVSDNNYSSDKVGGSIDDIKNHQLTSDSDNYFSSIEHYAGIYKRDEIDLVNKRYRFGINTVSDTIHTVKEYLFFTKPDLNIYPNPVSIANSYNGPLKLNEGLQSQVYWMELLDKNPEVFYCLQDSLSIKGDHFNHLLENTVQSNLSIPTLSSEMVDTPTNLYGVGYQYHGSAEASDDSFDFSLEFRDVRGLPVYNFFKAYEDYQTLKHHGVLETNIDYILNKILYDQYSIFKFLVDEDGETIIYYAQLYGVKSKSLPRDVFENIQFDNGLSYTIDFNAAFFEDMKPNILSNFNMLSLPYFRTLPYKVGVYNNIMDRADTRAVKAALVTYDTVSKTYKLRWRGDDTH